MLRVFEQRQHQALLWYRPSRTVNAPVFEPAVELVADHRPDAHGLDTAQ